MPILPSLYDDWKARREQIAWLKHGVRERRAVEGQVLDWLLRYYRDSPEAARPARFPLKTEAYVNHRAIVVHHHLGGPGKPNITNRTESEARVRSVLERMFSEPPPEENGEDDEPFLARLEPTPEEQADTVRAMLCDSDPFARLLAVLELRRVGTLDDISLLSDLLSLPAQPNEHPLERRAMLQVMRRLSGLPNDDSDLPRLLRKARRAAATRARARLIAPISRPLWFWLLAAAVICLPGIVAIVGSIVRRW